MNLLMYKVNMKIYFMTIQILKEKVEDKEGQLVLCAALEREFLKPYIDLFKEMGISISSIDILTNSVIKLTESIDKLKINHTS